MYRTHSPYAQPQPGYPATTGPVGAYGPPPPAATGAIQPNDTTHTQILSQDGRVLYQIFRTMPASIQTASGLITGLQWAAAEQVPNPPPGSRQADPDFVNAWVQGLTQQPPAAAPPPVAASKSNKDRDKESKRHSRHTSDYDSLHDARDKDAKRRSSFNSSTQQQPAVPFPGYPPAGAPVHAAPGAYPAFGGYPQAHPGGYPTQPYPAYHSDPNQQQQGAYGNPYGSAASGYPDLSRQMGDLNLNRSKESDREHEKKASRSRRQSTVETARPAPENLYGGYPVFGAANAAPPGAVTGGAGIYGYPLGGTGTGSNHSSTRPSPNTKPGEIPQYGFPQPYATSSQSQDDRDASRRKRANSTAPPPVTTAGASVYPAGHILEGQPKPPGVNDGPPPRSLSRAASPNPYNAMSQLTARPKSQMGRPSPIPPSHTPLTTQLAAPEAFSRAVNTTLPYLGFKPVKIVSMDGLFEKLPKMPEALQTHDVPHLDWFRFGEDLTLAWQGRLPMPPPSQREPTPPKPSAITAELLHTWNDSFFERRGVEIVLYRGRRRCSGRFFGREDLPRGVYEDDVSDESSSTSSQEDDSDDPYPSAPPNIYHQGGYSRGADDLAAARRRYFDQKSQETQRRRERRQRRRERRKNRTYTLYAICIREGPPKAAAPPQGYGYSPSVPQNVAMPSLQPGALGAVPSAYPGMLTPAPPGVATSSNSNSSKRPKHSRSSSYGGGYQ